MNSKLPLEGNSIKHVIVIVPELRGSPVNSKSMYLQEKTQPSSFKVKTQPEEGALDRSDQCAHSRVRKSRK